MIDIASSIKANICIRSVASVTNKTRFLFFRFDIETKSDEEAKDVIIQLSQRDTCSLLMENKETLIIGFTILKVEFNRKYRLHQFSEEQIVNKSDYIKSKHIFLRANLPRGRYVIIVTTFEPGQSTDFLLRVFTGKNCLNHYLDI